MLAVRKVLRHNSGMQPSVSDTVARVRAWLCAPELDHLQVASEAGVDEKTIRIARTAADWNPTAKTLEKLEAVMLGGTLRRSKKRVA